MLTPSFLEATLGVISISSALALSNSLYKISCPVCFSQLAPRGILFHQAKGEAYAPLLRCLPHMRPPLCATKINSHGGTGMIKTAYCANQKCRVPIAQYDLDFGEDPPDPPLCDQCVSKWVPLYLKCIIQRKMKEIEESSRPFLDI